jgi:hypothetical protein
LVIDCELNVFRKSLQSKLKSLALHALKQMGPVSPPAPRYACIVPDELGDRLSRGCPGQLGRCDAFRSPRVPSHRECSSIVMLVASGLVRLA